MPLYKRRIKQSYLSQSSEAIDEEPEFKSIKISSEIYQTNGSQTAIEDILQSSKNLRSPVYPEALPRTASEPNESAFLKNEADNTYLEQSTLNSKTKNLIKYSNEPFDDLFSGEKKCRQIDQNLSESVKIETIAGNTKITQNKKIYVNDKNGDDILSKNVLSTNTGKKSKSYNEKKTKGNKLLKEKVSNKKNIKTFSSENENEYILPNEYSEETQKASHNSSTYAQEQSITSQRQYSDLVNSSSNQSFSGSDANKSFNEISNKDMKKSKNVNVLSQRSNISMNDPVVKNAYMEFMKKKDTFRRVDTPKGLKHDEKMKWLQQQRNVGVYVHCDKCDKIRYLDDVKDPLLLPDKWYCKNNSDPCYNKCDIPEEKFSLQIQEDWIDNLYNAGSLVWARLEGYPWWPGIVDDDPNTECYYWLDSEITTIPSFYHVTFFDEKEVSRAWLKPNSIKPFIKEKDNPHYQPGNYSQFKKRIDVAIKQALEADKMSLLVRLAKFSFVARYKKPINAPKDVNTKKSKKIEVPLETVNEIKQNENSKKKFRKMVKKNKTNEKGKLKNGKLRKGMNPYDSSELLFDDFEIPSSPVIDDISLDLFEDV